MPSLITEPCLSLQGSLSPPGNDFVNDHLPTNPLATVYFSREGLAASSTGPLSW
ncbi:hypothetical protein PENARI_c010G02083 [Penicillium arizonense]|uniref:Uncharacterized protein n=1 Tax=Penicillium arizonense TaxID=1835702 RepID=A0A1F5LGK1_PENAI|nr:hypothetical protein PENARI_c010G02083 [Penicillium arizonense]OGE52343.1 hypothetical protein PENARI_c010G02083 [Penicillium arizonense]